MSKKQTKTNWRDRKEIPNGEILWGIALIVFTCLFFAFSVCYRHYVEGIPW